MRILKALLIISGALIAMNLFSLLRDSREPANTPIVPFAKATPTPTPDASEIAETKLRLQIAQTIKKDIDKKFGIKGAETSWHSSIKSVEVDGNTLTIKTDLFKNPAFYPMISGICGAASPYVFGSDHPEWGLERLEVRGEMGAPLVWRNRISDSCTPD